MEDIIITIRRMAESDAGAAAGIEACVFSEPWSRQAFLDSIKNDSYIYLVAEHDNELVGYAGCIIAQEDADITNIAVRDDYRRLGIASRLIQLLISEASGRGAQSVFLEVRMSNDSARSLYYKHGFKDVGIRRNFYRMPTEDAVIMEKKI